MQTCRVGTTVAKDKAVLDGAVLTFPIVEQLNRLELCNSLCNYQTCERQISRTNDICAAKGCYISHNAPRLQLSLNPAVLPRCNPSVQWLALIFISNFCQK